MKAEASIDPIDEIIPSPLAWWYRLAIGASVVAIAVVGSYYFGAGRVYPQPDCCGDGGRFVAIALTDEGDAVTINADLFNSSSSDIVINSAEAKLDGAEVLAVNASDEVADSSSFLVWSGVSLPVVAEAGSFQAVLITFVPTRCTDLDEPWGEVTLDLSVDGSPLSPLHRSYRLAPVFNSPASELTVFDATSTMSTSLPDTPLAAACALLGR